MTTKVTIEPAGHHVRVSVTDSYTSPGGLNHYSSEERVILPRDKGGKPVELYATTTRTITVYDIEPDSFAALEAEGKPIPQPPNA